MKHRIVTAAQMKEIERAGNAHGLPYLQMMENAGLAAYTQLRARLPQGGALLIVCGKGNNGGDGLVMARAAAQDGWRVAVLLAEGDPKTPDAMTNYARLADLPVTKCRDAAALAAQPFDAVVDALYGTGFHGSLRPAGLAACALMNRHRESGAYSASQYSVQGGCFSQHLITRWLPCAAYVPSDADVPENFSP